MKSKNPIIKLCPECGSISLYKNKRKFLYRKTHITGIPMKEIEQLRYTCMNCRNKFETPIIIDIRSNDPLECCIANERIIHKVNLLSESYKKLINNE